MGHPLRWFLPGVVYESTIRTIQERFLLRPGRSSRDLILGVIGRAQCLYPKVQLYAFVYMSNHAHLLLSADDGYQLASFLGYVNGNVAREMGRLHGWAGALWGRRHRPIPVLDDEALVGRLRYLLSQGVKEGLVASPRDWPGASALPGLLGDMTLIGRWVDRTLETRARRRGVAIEPGDFEESFRVRLTPLPAWAGLDAEELVARYEGLVLDVEREHRANASSVVGADVVCETHPHASPDDPERSPAPDCHASSRPMRASFRAAFRAFVDEFRAAALALRSTIVEDVSRARELRTRFPDGCFPPNLLYMSVPAGTRPPWETWVTA